MLGDEVVAEIRLIAAARAVVGAALIDMDDDSQSSVARVPAELMKRLAEALNMLDRAK